MRDWFNVVKIKKSGKIFENEFMIRIFNEENRKEKQLTFYFNFFVSLRNYNKNLNYNFLFLTLLSQFHKYF